VALKRKTRYVNCQIKGTGFGEFPMKHLRLVLATCGAACLIAASGSAYAFDIEGQDASLDDGSSHFATPVDDFIKSNGGARSLAMPLSGNSDWTDTHISQYGNSIAIPGPEQQAPAWTYSSPYFQRGN
jgi:hypothetical protein